MSNIFSKIAHKSGIHLLNKKPYLLVYNDNSVLLASLHSKEEYMLQRPAFSGVYKSKFIYTFDTGQGFITALYKYCPEQKIEVLTEMNSVKQIVPLLIHPGSYVTTGETMDKGTFPCLVLDALEKKGIEQSLKNPQNYTLVVLNNNKVYFHRPEEFFTLNDKGYKYFIFLHSKYNNLFYLRAYTEESYLINWLLLIN